jgi:hypothetical protein
VKPRSSKKTLSQPSPAPTDPICSRLEDVRKLAGVPTLRDFWKRLTAKKSPAGPAYQVSYGSVVKYHFNREPPATYLARVSEVFGVSLVWLVTGEGAATQDLLAARQAQRAKGLRRRVEEAFHEELAALGPEALEAIEAILWRLWRSARFANLQAFSTPEAADKHMVAVARELARALKAPLETLGLSLADLPSPLATENYLSGVALALAGVLEPIALAKTMANSTTED